MKAAKLIGTFVSPKVSLTLILSALKKTPMSAHLMILASVIRGSTRQVLEPHLADLANTLSQTEISQRSEEVRNEEFKTGHKLLQNKVTCPLRNTAQNNSNFTALGSSNSNGLFRLLLIVITYWHIDVLINIKTSSFPC